MLREGTGVEDLGGLLLMAVRAFALLCGAMLPLLFIDLVWVGFVHGGVRSAVPMMVPAEELAVVEQDLSAAQVALVEACYSPADTLGIRHFAGRAHDLGPFSPLSRTLSHAAVPDSRGIWHELVSLHEGMKWARRQYQLVGFDVQVMGACCIVRTLKEMTGCLVVLALARACGAKGNREAACTWEVVRGA